MRPHRLSLQAFGPFAGPVSVDLDALAAGGLFLLHGETGAGKTTVLDALGYALFGQVPGPRAQARRLRSDHAALGVRTEVALEVTLDGRRLEVTRWPEWERPKRRGDGITTAPAGAQLRELTGAGWRVLSTRVQEVSDELGRLLGMTAAQFFQVVLLPQGAFAAFLRASADERGALLARLFATDRFGAVEEWLAEQRRHAAGDVDLARRAVVDVATRIAQAVGIAEPPEVPGLEWLASLRSEWAGRHADAAVAAERADADYEQAREEHARVRELARRQQRRREADLRASLLMAAEPAQLATTAELAAARRAVPVAPVLARLAEAAGEQRAALAAEAAARAALADSGLHSAQARMLRVTAGDLVAETGRLRELGELENAVGQRREALRALRAAGATQAARLEACEQRLAALPAEHDRCLRQVNAAQAACSRLEPGRATVAGLTARLGAARRLDVVETGVAALEPAWQQARTAHNDARDRHNDLRERRVDGMAAELAQNLLAGDPCPVCGAVEHPDPTEMAPEHVSRDDERAAAQAVSAAEEVLRQAETALAAAREQRATLRGELGDTAPAALAADLEQARETLTADEQLAALLPELTAARAALDTERNTLGERRTQLSAGVASTRREAALAEESLATDTAALDAARGEDPSVAARAARLTLLAATCTDAADAADAAERAAAARARTEQQAREAVRAAGFEDPEAATSAVRPAAVLDRLEAAQRRHDDERAALAELLADPDLAVSPELAADEPAAAAGVAAAARTARGEAAVLADAERVGRDLSVLAGALAERLAALAPLEARHDEVGALAALAAGQGQNTLRMRLSAFVLAARLEEVAAVANGRLLRMSGGRYTLRHTDAVAGARRSGLGLLVSDAWTGQDRDTATLSGGESFFASLALALGLADVVAAEAGGAAIDTLFVDEGFGSLDEETLEQVMDTLDSLRDGGRVVGVVSHVAELRQRITSQVRVHKGRQGSAVEVVTA